MNDPLAATPADPVAVNATSIWRALEIASIALIATAVVLLVATQVGLGAASGVALVSGVGLAILRDRYA